MTAGAFPTLRLPNMTGAHGAVFLIWQVLTVPPADEPELSEWADAVETTYLASLLPSWLLIDAVKVGIATALSSEAALLALGTAEQPEEGSLEAGLRRRRAAKAKVDAVREQRRQCAKLFSDHHR